VTAQSVIAAARDGIDAAAGSRSKKRSALSSTNFGDISSFRVVTGDIAISQNGSKKSDKNIASETDRMAQMDYSSRPQKTARQSPGNTGSDQGLG